MKKLIALILVSFSVMTFLTGCFGLSIGGGTTTKPVSATLGQELIDLQRAKDAGVITEPEYEAQKAKLLGAKQ